MSKKEEILIDLVSWVMTFVMTFLLLFIYFTLAEINTVVGLLFLVWVVAANVRMWLRYKGEKVDAKRTQ